MSIETSPTRVKAAATARAAAGAVRSESLQPLLAGAHARGMADALELAGVAAVMIDAQGMVLHAGDRARELFCGELRLEFDHLVGADAESTCALQTLISQGLEAGGQPAPVIVARREGLPLKLHARRVPGAANNANQMLKLLIIIEEVHSRPAGN